MKKVHDTRSIQGKDGGYITPKGMLKSFIINMLDDGPLHGYALMKKIRLSTGFWKPSPGIIYPTLALLEKEGMVSKHREGNKVVYSLTPAGKKMAKAVHDIRNKFRKRGIERLHKMMTNEDFVRLNEKSIMKVYGGKPSLDSVQAANSIWVSVMKYFYTRQESRRADVEKLLKETNSKLKKMLEELEK